MEYCRIHTEDAILIVAIMNIQETLDRGELLEIRIEKENDMDVYAEFTLPAYHCHHAYGFKETELMQLEQFLRDNAVTIWRMGKGEIVAEGAA